MMNHNAFEELSRRLSALLPAANTMGEELRTKIEQTLKKGFAELNLMTQDDFEAQAVTLQRAMQRIEELEAQIKALEARLDQTESQ
jgi:BMFP domain-containing protein YqiC